MFNINKVRRLAALAAASPRRKRWATRPSGGIESDACGVMQVHETEAVFSGEHLRRQRVFELREVSVHAVQKQSLIERAVEEQGASELHATSFPEGFEERGFALPLGLKLASLATGSAVDPAVLPAGNGWLTRGCDSKMLRCVTLDSGVSNSLAD